MGRRKRGISKSAKRGYHRPTRKKIRKGGAEENRITQQIKYTSDQNMLTKAAINNPHGFIRCQAIKKITDQQILFTILKTETEDDCLVVAADRLTDDDLVKNLFIGEWPKPIVIEQLLHRIEEDQDLFQEILKRNIKNIKLWGLIIPKIKRRRTIHFIKKIVCDKFYDGRKLREELDRRLAELPNSVDFILD